MAVARPLAPLAALLAALCLPPSSGAGMPESSRPRAERMDAWREMLVEILYRLGLDSVAALRGRTDLLMHLDYDNHQPAQ